VKVEAIPEVPEINAKIGVMQQGDDAIAINDLLQLFY